MPLAQPSRHWHQLVLPAVAAALSAGLLASDVAAAQSTTRSHSAPAQTQPASQPATQPAATTAPRKDLPAANKIIDAALEEMGGKKVIEAIESTHVKAIRNMPMAGEMTIEIYSAKPDKFFIKLMIPAAGEVRVGSDGEIGWTDDPTKGGIQLLSGEQTKQTSREADLFSMLVNLQSSAKELETVDRTDFADHDCYKVRVVSDSGAERFLFFDAQDKKLRGNQLMEDGPRGPIATTAKFSEWKHVGDINVFTRIEIEQMGMQIVTDLSDIEFNKVDPALFEVPAEAKELAAKRQAATQPAATEPATQPHTPPVRPSTAPGLPRPPGKPG